MGILLEKEAKIISNQKLAEKFFKLVITSQNIAKEAFPGQFVNIKVSEGTNPLLRRPISISRVDKNQGTIEFVYKVVGKGTELLSQKKAEEELDLLGPLGNGFNLKENLKHAILVGGGIGAAPLVYLAETLKEMHIETFAFLGAPNKESHTCHNDFKCVEDNLFLTTDDGSFGKSGFVTKELEEFLKTKILDPDTIVFACGPEPMLKEVVRIAKEKNLKSQISLEEHMACGLGACLGCARKMKDGTQVRVCKDGPVFEGNEIF